MRNLLAVILLTFGCAGVILHAQTRTSDVKFRLAQSYERGGDFETAAKLYEEAFAKDSTNGQIAEALRRVLLQLKRYPGVVALLEGELRKNPRDLGLLSQLGSVYVLMSELGKADEAWERAVALDPANAATYTIVGSAMIQSRLFEHAITLYRRGQKACGDPMLFVADIAYMYSITLNYAEATREYLLLIRQSPAQLGFVQSRIASYTGRADGLSAATTVVEDSIKRDPGNLPLHQLLAWLYMEGKQFDRAYGVYTFIDGAAKAMGRELYNFAERALREKAYSSAAKAYQEILSSYPKFDKMGIVKYGYARTLEETEAEADTLKIFGAANPLTPRPESESTPLYSGAIAAYIRVITEHPGGEFSARALLRIAAIKQERYFDLDGARSALESLEKEYARFPAITVEGALRLGDVLVASGDLRASEARFRTLSESGTAAQGYREQALFRLAELDYFQERFQAALSKLSTLTVNASSDITNDALRLQIFIQENIQPTDAGIRRYAHGDLLIRQHKLSEALPVFESIVKDFPGTDIIDETLAQIGDLCTHLGRYTDAVGTYERLSSDFPESIVLDRTLMKLGQVYQFGLKDKPKAVATYQRLLEKYPNSIYAGEARRSIRVLRGDGI
jgi:tetratricopeptide (TPR) repeat protein